MNFLFTSTPLKYFNQSFWRDEAFSYVLANKNIGEIILYTAQDFNPPLYYIVLHFWMNIFSSSEISIRTLSFLFFWATVYIVFDFMHDVLHISYKKASFYIFLVIINPILLSYAFEARMYTMFSFFAGLSYYALHTSRKKLYIASLLLGLFTHYFMVFVVLSQLIYVFFTRKKHTSLYELIRPYIFTAVVFLPWVIFVLFQKSGEGDSFWIPKPELHELFLLPGVMYTGMETFIGFYKDNTPISLFSLISIMLLILTIIIIGYLKTHNQKHIEKKHLFLSLALWAFLGPILVFLLSFYKSGYLPRYLIFSSPGILLLTIFSLNEMKKNIAILLALLLMVFTVHHITLQVDYRTRENIAPVMREINALAGEEDLLYVTDVLDFFTAQYYFDEHRVFIYNSVYEQIPPYVGKTLISPDQIKHTLPNYPDKAFILKKNREYDIVAAY